MIEPNKFVPKGDGASHFWGWRAQQRFSQGRKDKSTWTSPFEPRCDDAANQSLTFFPTICLSK